MVNSSNDVIQNKLYIQIVFIKLITYILIIFHLVLLYIMKITYQLLLANYY